MNGSEDTVLLVHSYGSDLVYIRHILREYPNNPTLTIMNPSYDAKVKITSKLQNIILKRWIATEPDISTEFEFHTEK